MHANSWKAHDLNCAKIKYESLYQTVPFQIYSNFSFMKSNNGNSTATVRSFKKNKETSFCSYARPAQPCPNRTRLCGPCIAAVVGD